MILVIQWKKQEWLYQRFSQSMTDRHFVRICREYSFDAVKHFPDEYFDLVYIDADHTYEGCKRDIEDWYPKVKTGRFLMGDDYSNSTSQLTGVKFGVIPAVDEFARKHGYQVHEITEHGWVIIK